jgi:hypothetical protein
MLDSIKTKIRALIEDWTKSDFETFEYSSGDQIFTLSESNIVTIAQVLKNGVTLGSGEYSYDSTTNKITIVTSLSSGDIIEVDYTYYKYSTTELTEYIRGALVWISIKAYCATDYELEDGEIYPTPDNKTTDLIALVASILIKPDWTEYRLPNLTVVYERRIPKDQKIERLITRFNAGIGVTDILEFD